MLLPYRLLWTPREDEPLVPFPVIHMQLFPQNQLKVICIAGALYTRHPSRWQLPVQSCGGPDCADGPASQWQQQQQQSCHPQTASSFPYAAAPRRLPPLCHPGLLLVLTSTSREGAPPQLLLHAVTPSHGTVSIMYRESS